MADSNNLKNGYAETSSSLKRLDLRLTELEKIKELRQRDQTKISERMQAIKNLEDHLAELCETQTFIENRIEILRKKAIDKEGIDSEYVTKILVEHGYLK